MQYKPYTLNNYLEIPQIGALSSQQIRDIEVVGTVLPFRTNNYIVDNLIDWERAETDPLFIATFPQKGMLSPEDYQRVDTLLRDGASKEVIRETVTEIRQKLNPHPAGQLELNVPALNGESLPGIQHKYRETVLLFPSQGQTCHAYCTFCFRWPQFVKGMEDLKIASREIDTLVEYLKSRPEVTDVLVTGGDPMVMKAGLLARYIEPLLALPGIRTIRIGTRSLSFWPYRYVTDDDAEEMLTLFCRVREAGKHLAFMAHFNHPVELLPEIVPEAVRRIRETGAVIRTQSPLLRHINDSEAVWAEMWRRQVDMGCVPYYMFMARDTGAQRYFSVTLQDAWRVYQGAFQAVSGICRTAEGPVMSALPGKVQVMGTAVIDGEKVFVLRMVQGRNPDWADRPFFAAFDESAIWFNDLKPAFGEQEFFFDEELKALLVTGETESEF
jgi:KamA family protein